MSETTQTARVRSVRALVLPLALALVFLLVVAQSVQAGGDPLTTVHRVVAGDTLWDIAVEHTSPDEDVRATIRAIKRLNELDGGIIHPGQILNVPMTAGG